MIFKVQQKPPGIVDLDAEEFETAASAIPRSDWVRFWATLPPRHTPEGLAREIRLSITEIAVEMATALGMFGFVASLVVSLIIVPLDTPRGQLWLSAHSLVYVWIGVAVVLLRRRMRSGTLTVAAFNVMSLPIAVGCGIAWGTLPLVVGTEADGLFYIATCVAAMYCLVGSFLMAPHWPISLTYGTILLGCVIATFVILGRSETSLVLALSSALLVTIGAISVLASVWLVNVRYEMVLARERKQLINLLLQDYERGGHDWIWEADSNMTFTRVPPRMTVAADGDLRFAVGATLPGVLAHCPDALTQLRSGEPFQAHIRTDGTNGPGEIRLWGRPNVVSGRCAGYRGVGSDEGAARRAIEAERTRERLDAMVHLTSGLAHDFNNLLATILGSVELATMHSEVPEPMQPYLQRAADACLRTRRITADLAVASGLDASSQPAPFRVSEAVTDVLSDLRPLYPDVDISVSGDTAVWALADKSHFMRAVRNLTENGCQAVAHNPGGIGALRIAIGTEHIPGSLQMVRLAVSDDGPGLPAGVGDRLFEPFFTTRKSEGGTGLGLAVAHGFARQAGGSLDIGSSSHGAVFRLLIPEASPVITPPLATIGTIDISESTAGNSSALSGRFVVIDDDRHVAATIAMWIESLGGRADVAHSVAEAIERFGFDTHDVECVISDLVLPDGDGFEVIAALRESRPDLPAVYVSGFSQRLPGSVAEHLRCPFVAKPFTLLELMHALALAGVGAGVGEMTPAAQLADAGPR